jgi:hypothetical protein
MAWVVRCIVCAGGLQKRQRQLPARETVESRLAQAVQARLAALAASAAASSADDADTSEEMPFPDVLETCLSSFTGSSTQLFQQACSSMGCVCVCVRACVYVCASCREVSKCSICCSRVGAENSVAVCHSR